MLRGSVLLLGLLLAAGCAAGEPGDFVLYRPPPSAVGGPPVSRSLILAPPAGALLVTRVFDGPVELATGEIPPATWEDLRTRLARLRYLPEEAASPREDPETFQIYARLGRVTIDVTRDPEAPVEAELLEVRDLLAGLAERLSPPGDPVRALDPFLASREAGVRGQATLALLLLRENERVADPVRRAAERRLQERQRDERNPAILERIRER